MKESDQILKVFFNKTSASYPRGKTEVCRGSDCTKPATGGGLFCDNCYSRSKAKDPTFSTKGPSGSRNPQYVDKYTQNQIWNSDPRNKKQANKNLPKDDPNCGAVCQMRHEGMSEEEAMSHWNKENKKASQILNDFLKLAWEDDNRNLQQWKTDESLKPHGIHPITEVTNTNNELKNHGIVPINKMKQMDDTNKKLQQHNIVPIPETKASKVLKEFFKKADCDGDINGSTDAVMEVAKKNYTEPTDDAKWGLHNKEAILKNFFA